MQQGVDTHGKFFRQLVNIENQQSCQRQLKNAGDGIVSDQAITLVLVEGTDQLAGAEDNDAGAGCRLKAEVAGEVALLQLAERIRHINFPGIDFLPDWISTW